MTDTINAKARTEPQATAQYIRRPSRRKTLFKWARAATVLAVTIVLVFPLVWMLLASFKQNVDITNPHTVLFAPTIQNYVNVLVTNDFLRYGINSFIIATVATLLSLLIGVPAAYAVSKYKLTSVAGFILLARVIPGISLLIPWYYIFAQVGLVGSFQALIISHLFVSLPVIVAIMSSFFDGMSAELEEAGQIDGLTLAGTFFRITLRLAVPGVATSAILSFIFSWNNFLFALILSGKETTTLPAAIYQFISYLGVDWGGLMAASVVITLPVMIVTVILQKYIVAGLTAGATKG
jgi:multiple sugar transport system permease protein